MRKVASTPIRFPDPPARSDLLQRLSYPGPPFSFSASWFRWAFLTAYSKPKFAMSGLVSNHSEQKVC